VFSPIWIPALIALTIFGVCATAAAISGR
jgi:hypothetical protein